MSGVLEKRGMFAPGWFSCERMGRHFFVRDYILGIFPYGEPYCLHCGKNPGGDSGNTKEVR